MGHIERGNKGSDDSNFSPPKSRRFYALFTQTISRSSRGRGLGGYSVLWREIGGIWRTAPGEDDNYVYSIAL